MLYPFFLLVMTTKPFLSIGMNWIVGLRAAPSSPHSPFPDMNLA